MATLWRGAFLITVANGVDIVAFNVVFIIILALYGHIIN
jgi:hypothetical protein